MQILDCYAQVRQLVRADEFKGLASRVGGEVKQRKVWEVLDNAGGPPPLPLRSAYSSRSPSSRQVRLHPSPPPNPPCWCTLLVAGACSNFPKMLALP